MKDIAYIIKEYIDRFIEMVKNNTNGFAFLINQGLMSMMLFEWIHWREDQMFGFLAFVNAVLTFIVGKTTMAVGKIDRRVDEKVALREMSDVTGTGTGTGDGMTKPTTRTSGTRMNTAGGAGGGRGLGLLLAVGLTIGMVACGSMQAGCGPKLPPGTAPEVVVGVRATQLTEALRAVVPSIEAEVCRESNPNKATCLGTADFDKVMAGVGEAGKGAQTLGPALQAVSDARAANDAAATAGANERVRVILGSIQASLTKATVAPTHEATRNTVVRLLSNITTLLFTVSSL